MFIDKYKYKNIIQYKKIIFEKMWLFIFYFTEFSENYFILKKNHLNNYKLKKSD